MVSCARHSAGRVGLELFQVNSITGVRRELEAVHTYSTLYVSVCTLVGTVDPSSTGSLHLGSPGDRDGMRKALVSLSLSR